MENTKISFENFKELPGYVAFKNKEGAYLWGNNNITELAGTNLVDKTDIDKSISWYANGANFIADHKKIMATGRQMTLITRINKGNKAILTLTYIKPTRTATGQIDEVALVALEVDK